MLTIVPPTGGEGGNSALHDAASLLEHLSKIASAADRHAAVDTEIKQYEKDMLKFSWSKVSKSYYLCQAITIEGYLFPYLLRGLLRILNYLVGVKHV
jgi:2-polyprenyl-6-methoxyphenol hydroxylase-like FAD-dependent oxidoreductase